MTCIVGLVDDGKVYMGGDSAGVAGLKIRGRADKKVFKTGNFIMGFTSSFRMGDLLKYDFNPPKRHPDIDILKYMVTEFINEVRNCLKRGGYATKKEEVESGGTFLVGYERRLFSIYDDYQVGENILPFAACGCGEDYALGSLYSTSKISDHHTKVSGRMKIEMALEAAQEFSAGVREPFHIEVLE